MRENACVCTRAKKRVRVSRGTAGNISRIIVVIIVCARRLRDREWCKTMGKRMEKTPSRKPKELTTLPSPPRVLCAYCGTFVLPGT